MLIAVALFIMFYFSITIMKIVLIAVICYLLYEKYKSSKRVH